MTDLQGYKDLSFSIFESAFKDLIKDCAVEQIEERLSCLRLVEDKTRKESAMIGRLNRYLKTDKDARRFFEKRNFYPWIEFVNYDAEYLVDRYREFVGR